MRTLLKSLLITIPLILYGCNPAIADHLRNSVAPMEWKDFRNNPLCEPLQVIAWRVVHMGYKLHDSSPGLMIYQHPQAQNYVVVTIDIPNNKGCVIGAGIPQGDLPL